MSFEERRKFHRIDIHNLPLDISVKGIEDSISSSIRCRIVNLSMDGLKLETPSPIELQDVHLKSYDSENSPNEIEGKIVYCEEISQKNFHVGIGLIGSNMEKFKFISRLTNQFDIYHVNINTIDDNMSSTI